MEKQYPYGRLKAFLKIVIILLVIVIIRCYIIVRKEVSKQNGNTVSIDSISKEIVVPDDITINMAVIGDIMCHNTQYMDAYIDGKYDFSYVFSNVEEMIKTADISVRKFRNYICRRRKRI